MSGTLHAKVTDHVANKLGDELTLIGAQSSANTDGSIPAYAGGLTANPNIDPLKNIYAHEKPLFTITADNVEQYKNNLSDGQLALFKKFPDTYKMPIYQTHRTASHPKSVYEKARKNATQSELVDGGNGLSNFDETIPFAIPQNGLEVIWNHVSRFRGPSLEKNGAQVAVQRNGDFLPIKTRGLLSAPHYLSEGYDAQKDDLSLIHI